MPETDASNPTPVDDTQVAVRFLYLMAAFLRISWRVPAVGESRRVRQMATLVAGFLTVLVADDPPAQDRAWASIEELRHPNDV